MLCPRLPKSGVNPYTLYPYTPVHPHTCPLTLRGASWGLGRTPRGGGHEEATLCLLPCPILSPVLRTHAMYVAKGGRRRPGQISRLATPPGSQVGPCRPALMSALWGENWSRPQPSRAGPRPDVDGAVPPHKLTDPPGVGQMRYVRCERSGVVPQLVAPTLPMLPPHLPPSHPPTHPPPPLSHSAWACPWRYGTGGLGWGGGGTPPLCGHVFVFRPLGLGPVWRCPMSHLGSICLTPSRKGVGPPSVGT